MLVVVVWEHGAHEVAVGHLVRVAEDALHLVVYHTLAGDLLLHSNTRAQV